MPRLLTGIEVHRGIAHGIVELHREIAIVSSLSKYRRALSASEVEEWFRESRPEMFAAITSDTGRLYGYTWAWIGKGSCCTAFTYPRISPHLDRGEAVYWATVLLAWSRYSLLELQGYRGSTLNIRLGLLYNTYRDLFENLLKGCNYIRLKVSGYLMELTDIKHSKTSTEDYRIKRLTPAKIGEEAWKIAEIYNDAFSSYNDYWSWSVNSIKRYYTSLFSKYKAILLLAETRKGEPIGLIETHIYNSLKGLRIGYHNLLAVKKKYQGRGIGKTLLSLAEKWLLEQKVDTIILDAEPDAYGFYLKQGYRVIRTGYDLVTPITCLPENPLHGFA